MNFLLKKERSMRHGIRKPRGLKVRRYADLLIGLKEYLDSFPGATMSEKIGATELN